jgi:hypothetical protein
MVIALYSQIYQPNLLNTPYFKHYQPILNIPYFKHFYFYMFLVTFFVFILLSSYFHLQLLFFFSQCFQFKNDFECQENHLCINIWEACWISIRGTSSKNGKMNLSKKRSNYHCYHISCMWNNKATSKWVEIQ